MILDSSWYPMAKAAIIPVFVLGLGSFAALTQPYPSTEQLTDSQLEWQSSQFQRTKSDIEQFIKANFWGVEERARFSHYLDTVQEADIDTQEIELASQYKDYNLVGIVEAQGDLLVLLISPDSTIERVALGEALPDGQTFERISGDRIELQANGHTQVLRLYENLNMEQPNE